MQAWYVSSEAREQKGLMMASISLPRNPYSHGDSYHCRANTNGSVTGSSRGVSFLNFQVQTAWRSLVLWQLPPSSFSHGNALHIGKASADVPDYLPATWAKSRGKKLVGPRLDLTAEQTVQCQLDALKYNNEPHQDHGIEVMYRFTGFDPFERSKYFGPFFDLGQFERFRRIFHHSTYRVLLSYKESKILSSLYVGENCFKQRVWIRGSRPEEEEIFEFTMIQQVGGCWDGYWLTESLRHDGEGITKGVAY